MRRNIFFELLAVTEMVSKMVLAVLLLGTVQIAAIGATKAMALGLSSRHSKTIYLRRRLVQFIPVFSSIVQAANLLQVLNPLPTWLQVVLFLPALGVNDLLIWMNINPPMLSSWLQ